MFIWQQNQLKMQEDKPSLAPSFGWGMNSKLDRDLNNTIVKEWNMTQILPSRIKLIKQNRKLMFERLKPW